MVAHLAMLAARMTRVAAIDCGTNALRLLIADVDTSGVLRDVVRLMRTVRLGEGVDSTGEFSYAALERTFAVCEEYAQLIADHGAERSRFVATSASRDVSNRAQFVDGVTARMGISPEVIAGTEEAGLSYEGATRSLFDVVAPALVVDIGGGSTEFVLGEQSVSVNIGCVRMTERHLHSDPPTAAEIALVRSDLAEAMRRAGESVDLRAAGTLVGVAGTVTTVAARALGLESYDPEILHGAVIEREPLERAIADLVAMSRAERAALPYMHPGRVDIIGGGALVLGVVVEAVGLPTLTVSECDILDGIAYRLAAETA
jgi:exopolyphosphatase/guanosine-5'-triphosphate,3'-diphosphate pyrophosphatase